MAKAAFAAQPGTVKTYYYRGDSACHESGLVNWLRDEKRADGPQGFIGFEHQGTKPLRYVGIRIRKRQGCCLRAVLPAGILHG